MPRKQPTALAECNAELELVQKQEMWLGFHPAAKFRKLELLGDIVDTLL